MQDLWADFADEAFPTEGAARDGGLRQRRLTEQATLLTLRSWLHREYLLPYGTSLGATRIFARCYWIDGLGNARGARSGPQAAADPAEDAPTNRRGRQRVAAQTPALPPALQLTVATARRLACLDRPIALSGFLLHEQRGRRGTASKQPEAIATLTLPKEGGLLPASWPELAPTLLAALEQSAAVFLLNPLKDGLFRYVDLAPLYQRTAPTELFLWLPHRQIETRLLPSLRTTAGAAALTNLLRGDRWKGLLAREGADAGGIGDGLIELLAESMRGHFLTVQRLAFPVCTGPARVEAAPYTLLFATRRQDSLACLNDAVCRRERQLVVESHQGVLSEAWFTDQRAEQTASRFDALVQEALALGSSGRIRHWPELRQQLLLAHFGQYTLHDYGQVIARLLERGEVRCEWRKPSQDASETRIPGQDDLLQWKSK